MAQPYSDQGINFLSQLLKELYNLLQIYQIRTSPYHPQTDRLVERFNKTLKSLLRKLVNKEGRDWDGLLPYNLFAYREVPQDKTGFSPFELLHGREVKGPLYVLMEVWEANKKSDESVVLHILLVCEWMEMSELVERMLELHRCIRRSGTTRQPQRENFNQMKRYLCCCLQVFNEMVRTIPHTTKGG